VNKLFCDRIEQYYDYAERIAPGLGRDIVHHIAMELPQNIQNIDAYVHTSIRNAYRNKRSSFNRLYRPEDYSELPDIQDVSYNDKTYDAILLHTVLLELEIEGYSLYVSVFKDCYLGSSIRDFAERTGIDRRTITKICKFVQNEITKRYSDLDCQ
jgi:hypothetical protein